MIKLGSKVKDIVTGFTGIAVGKCQYLNGCDHIGIQPKVGKDGIMPGITWVDAPQVALVSPPKIPKGRRDKGGPRSGPSPRKHPHYIKDIVKQ